MCVLILHLHPKHFSLFISSSLSLSFDSVSAHLLLLFLSCWTKKTFKGVVLHPHKKKAFCDWKFRSVRKVIVSSET